MNYNELDKYAEGLVNMANWNTTTVLRTYYKLKPHVIDRKIQRLAEQKNIDRIFASVESDTENMNHLHLTFAGRNITKPQIAKSMNVDKNQFYLVLISTTFNEMNFFNDIFSILEFNFFILLKLLYL